MLLLVVKQYDTVLHCHERRPSTHHHCWTGSFYGCNWEGSLHTNTEMSRSKGIPASAMPWEWDQSSLQPPSRAQLICVQAVSFLGFMLLPGGTEFYNCYFTSKGRGRERQEVPKGYFLCLPSTGYTPSNPSSSVFLSPAVLVLKLNPILRFAHPTQLAHSCLR